MQRLVELGTSSGEIETPAAALSRASQNLHERFGTNGEKAYEALCAKRPPKAGKVAAVVSLADATAAAARLLIVARLRRASNARAGFMETAAGVHASDDDDDAAVSLVATSSSSAVKRRRSSAPGATAPVMSVAAGAGVAAPVAAARRGRRPKGAVAGRRAAHPCPLPTVPEEAAASGSEGAI